MSRQGNYGGKIRRPRLHCQFQTPERHGKQGKAPSRLPPGHRGNESGGVFRLLQRADQFSVHSRVDSQYAIGGGFSGKPGDRLRPHRQRRGLRGGSGHHTGKALCQGTEKRVPNPGILPEYERENGHQPASSPHRRLLRLRAGRLLRFPRRGAERPLRRRNRRRGRAVLRRSKGHGFLQRSQPGGIADRAARHRR